ncbi:Myb-like DNA-binding domain containing protein [Trichomonas vaginalis G3]|uniref:Myb-like DNA-binding domain containing protein n=1 Tax=Trichomonas vaginalis (strain ATCC PRA-98 / G3) TaxID=412133 RepID=A2F8D7_TRIV3|nr:RNA polymerase II transcription regulator recruiting protein [Trichomonas vaginalis G3]EAX98839.1 Myb-like DNA-binding domain containing protein [Trichomonas vaginalis G3]KAI5532239.1 RNA polymerase II transcription regulator recruiting protein [Trichomonas vaginalis G3]|eukprot:XP_001311769.1 Myb-like DNA-binding domain containing protein [Trichomonas vaginalis G3]
MSIVSYRNSGKPHPRTNFSKDEDNQLLELVQMYGVGNWNIIASKLENCNVRQVRERYLKYLSPNIEKGPWTHEEDFLLTQKYNEIGPKWKQIARFFPKRTDISVKNRMNKLMRGVFKPTSYKHTPKVQSSAPSTPEQTLSYQTPVEVEKIPEPSNGIPLEVNSVDLFETELDDFSFGFEEFVL